MWNPATVSRSVATMSRMRRRLAIAASLTSSKHRHPAVHSVRLAVARRSGRGLRRVRHQLYAREAQVQSCQARRLAFRSSSVHRGPAGLRPDRRRCRCRPWACRSPARLVHPPAARKTFPLPAGPHKRRCRCQCSRIAVLRMAGTGGRNLAGPEWRRSRCRCSRPLAEPRRSRRRPRWLRPRRDPHPGRQEASGGLWSAARRYRYRSESGV